MICYECGINRHFKRKRFPKEVMGEYVEKGKKMISVIGYICSCCVKKGIR